MCNPAGTGQNMFGLNWGNGFITDEDIISSRGLSNPNKFFQRLVKKPYAKKVSNGCMQLRSTRYSTVNLICACQFSYSGPLPDVRALLLLFLC
jgi:hypothetical protein